MNVTISRGRVLVACAVAMAIAAGVVVYAIAGSGAFAADRAPGPIETAVARRLVRLSIPRAARRTANPFAQDAAAWRGAADHFAEHCASCHGTDGRGRSAIGALMYPPVPDLASREIQQFSDGALFAIVRNGVRWTGMPAFGSLDGDDEIWKLVSFIRHVPSLTAADLARHSADDDGAAATTIVMDGTRFQADEVTIALGDAVVWVNKDPFPHNVVSEAGGMHSGDLDPDATWRFRPRARGTFRYECTLHPGMTGVLRVK